MSLLYNLKYLHVLTLTLLHSERPKLYTILAFLSAIRLKVFINIVHEKSSLNFTPKHLSHILYNNIIPVAHFNILRMIKLSKLIIDTRVTPWLDSEWW